MEYKDYYKILGVGRDAKEEDIKKSYRKLARKYHPDVSKEANAEDKFKEVQEAYEVLKDSQKRAAYDQLGSNWKSGQEFRPPPGWQNNFAGGGQFEEMDLGGFSDFFASIFGGARGGMGGFQRQARPQKGQDERASISISLEDAFKGGTKSIQMQVPEYDARGQGFYKNKSLKVTIPPGILSGQQLRLANQGSPGYNNGPAGDLYLEITIAPHPMFSLDKSNVTCEVNITPWEAALGGKIKIPTLGGDVEMKIAPGAKSGQKLRLKGRGLPNKKLPGDQFVVLQIQVPPIKTEADKAFYEKMASQMPFNPR